MVLEGPLSELMVKVEPSLYMKYVTTNSKVNPLLYVKIHKSLYGMIFTTFLKHIVKDLDDYGFEKN